MINKDLLRSSRSEFRMKLTIVRLGRHGPIAKQSDGYFRFACPACHEHRDTINPRNNLSHCFSCGENFNNIDLMMSLGYDFVPAVEILKNWLEEYQRDLGRRKPTAETALG